MGGIWLEASCQSYYFFQSFHPTKGAIGKPIQLFSRPGSVQASPTFSPDGSSLVFVSDHGGTPRIYQLSLADRMLQKGKAAPKDLGGPLGEATSPSWSPDGKKLAYSAKVGTVRQIWVYDFALEKHTQLTTGFEDKENPSWAQDSLHLVYNTTSPSYQLYVLDLLTKKPFRITCGEGRFHYPYWEK